MRHLTVLVMAGVMNAAGQQAVVRPRFEAASVKPAAGNVDGFGSGCAQSLKMGGVRVDIECATVVTLIGYAFGLSPDRVTGPDWMMGPGALRFDITARVPRAGLEEQVPEMVQALLAERFKLTFHRVTTGQAIYSLVVAEGGVKVREAAAGPMAAAPDAPDGMGFFGIVQIRVVPRADAGGPTTMISSPSMGTVLETEGRNRIQQWHAPSISFAGLADLLDQVAPLSLPVIDMTGLKRRYEMILEVSLNDLPGPRSATQNARLDLEAAVLKGFNDGLRKLGLQLERREGPVETFVVDHVEK